MSDTKNEHIRPLAALGGKQPPAPSWFEWAISHPSEEAEVDVAGAKIRYSAWGERGRRGLVFIHGGRAHRNWWRPIAPFFAENYRVAALDISGMGDSDWRETYSCDLVIDEIFAVIDAAGLGDNGRPIVIGHSFGGWMTLAAVERDGEKLGGAIVVDSPLGVPDPDEGYRVSQQKKGEDSPEIRPNRIYNSLEEPLTRFRFLPNQTTDALYMVDYIARQGVKQVENPEGGAGWSWKFDPAHGRNFSIHFNRDLLIAARCPLAFIYGEKSAFVGGDGFEHLKQQSKGRSPFIVMPSVQHHLMMEEPLAFVTAIKTLLTCWPIRVGGA